MNKPKVAISAYKYCWELDEIAIMALPKDHLTSFTKDLKKWYKYCNKKIKKQKLEI